jgi:hypothetical protein
MECSIDGGLHNDNDIDDNNNENDDDDHYNFNNGNDEETTTTTMMIDVSRNVKSRANLGTPTQKSFCPIHSQLHSFSFRTFKSSIKQTFLT